MFRIAATAFCLVATSAHADTLVGLHHTQNDGYTGSFSDPINYRPNRVQGRVVVRTSGYSEANTLIIKRGRAGVTTRTSVAPPQGITGQNLVADRELQTLAKN